MFILKRFPKFYSWEGKNRGQQFHINNIGPNLGPIMDGNYLSYYSIVMLCTKVLSTIKKVLTERELSRGQKLTYTIFLME